VESPGYFMGVFPRSGVVVVVVVAEVSDVVAAPDDEDDAHPAASTPTRAITKSANMALIAYLSCEVT
jgi:hypothetical protein